MVETVLEDADMEEIADQEATDQETAASETIEDEEMVNDAQDLTEVQEIETVITDDAVETETDAIINETEADQIMNETGADEVDPVDETLVDEENEIASETILAQGTSGGINWFYYDDGSLLISKGSSGVMPNYTSPTSPPWDQYSANIKQIVINNGITRIGNYAFASSTSGGVTHYGKLSSVHIGSDVVAIGDDAFKSMPNVTTIDFPESLVTIGREAFQGSSLTSVTLPSNVQNIGSWAFGNCPNLTHITIPASAAIMGASCFSSKKLVSAGPLGSHCNIEYGWTKAIPENAFSNGYLSSVILPSTLKSIGAYAFYWNNPLKEITIPSSVRTIEKFAFLACGFSKVILPYTVTSLPESDDVFDEKVEIWGYFGSEAEAYCENRANVFVSMGDGIDVGKASSFLNGLYTLCLNRSPDETGLIKWLDQLISRKKTGVDAAYGFIFSPECKKMNLCDSCFVQLLYHVFLGRPADSAGHTKWVNKLYNGVSREEVFNGFAMSNEFPKVCDGIGIAQGSKIKVPSVGTYPMGTCDLCGKDDNITEFVKRLYDICLARPADTAGLANWVVKLRTRAKTGEQVAYGFFFSSEFENKKYSNSAYVTRLYLAILNRTPDSKGPSNWVGKLESGTSRKTIFYGFTGSQEFAKLCEKYGIKAK